MNLWILKWEWYDKSSSGIVERLFSDSEKELVSLVLESVGYETRNLTWHEFELSGLKVDLTKLADQTAAEKKTCQSCGCRDNIVSCPFCLARSDSITEETRSQLLQNMCKRLFEGDKALSLLDELRSQL